MTPDIRSFEPFPDDAPEAEIDNLLQRKHEDERGKLEKTVRRLIDLQNRLLLFREQNNPQLDEISRELLTAKDELEMEETIEKFPGIAHIVKMIDDFERAIHEKEFKRDVLMKKVDFIVEQIGALRKPESN
ncbi:MAG: hypothetical protein G01um101472_376 [Parcubacteria group bacterium Gr01-1014_72]|nr:MAG: hypothetical protein G01um101472_376 [Parcubacteria group bacterium Gr01-1014_72]